MIMLQREKNRIFQGITSMIILVLFVVIILFSCNGQAYANEETSGTYGNNIAWSLDGDTLTFSGVGELNYQRYDADEDPIERASGWEIHIQEIKHIVVGEGITSLPADAFWKCSNVVDITLPDTLETIGAYAFQDCQSLQIINLPESLKFIGKCAFKSCYSLASVSWPQSVSVVEDYAFANCSSLTDILLPDTVTSIGVGAFEYCDSLIQLECPASLISVKFQAFFHCENLKQLEFKDGLMELGTGAYVYDDDFGTFSCCTNLQSVYIPSTVVDINMWHLFDGCTQLEYVNLPPWLTVIDECAFLDCINLKNIELPENLVEIKYAAFKNCSSLESIGLPDSLRTMGSYVFAGCEKLTSVEISDGVSAIKSCTFMDCTSLKHLIVPSSVQNIKMDAFKGCENITSIGPIGSGMDYEFGWTDVIPDYAYYSFDQLNHIIMPASVLKVANFEGCPNIKTAGPIGSGADYEFGWTTQLAEQAFRGLTGLENVKLPAELDEIGKWAFIGCTSLKTLNIPQTVHKIGDAVFSGAVNLLEVRFYGDMPDRINRDDGLASRPFDGCSTVIYYPGDNLTWNEKLFSEYGTEVTYIPMGTLDYAAKLLEVKGVSSGISLKWQEIIDAKQYVIMRKALGENQYKKLTTVSSSDGCQYVDESAVSGTTYYYRIKGVGETKSTSYSNSLKGMFVPKVTNVLAKNAAAGVTITFDEVKGVNGYQIYRSESASGKYKKVAELSGVSTVKYTDKSVIDQKKYYYKVRAFGKAGTTVVYGGFSAADYVYYVKATKINSVVNREKSKVVVSWSADVSSAGYEVTYSTSSNFANRKTLSVKPEFNSASIQGLTKGKTYYFKLRTIKNIDGKNRTSGWSGSKTIKVSL